MRTVSIIRMAMLGIFWAAAWGYMSAQEVSSLARNTNNLLNLYVPPHNRPVEVFFPISGMPIKPYIHLAYISARQISTSNQTDMIQELQRKTQEAGGDAVIILNNTPQTVYMHTLESVETVHTNTLSGLAIIYPENLHFVPGRIKSWEISIPDSTGRAWQVVATRSLDMMGNAGAITGKRQWYEWWYRRFLESFLEESGYYKDDMYGRVRVIGSQATQRRMTFAYQTPSSKRVVSRKLYQQGLLIENHRIHYSEDGLKVAYVEIWSPSNPKRRYWEFTELNADGRTKGFLYLLKENGKTSQFLRVDFVEYTYEEWEAAIEEILATKVVMPK